MGKEMKRKSTPTKTWRKAKAKTRPLITMSCDTSTPISPPTLLVEGPRWSLCLTSTVQDAESFDFSWEDFFSSPTLSSILPSSELFCQLPLRFATFITMMGVELGKVVGIERVFPDS